MTTTKSNLQKATDQARDYSMASIPTAVYQVGADSFITTCTPLESGVVVGVWMNGVSDGRYLSVFNR